MGDTFHSRLVSAYPSDTWPTLTRGVREGIRIADEVQRSTRFLSTQVGKDLRGLLRRAGIMWRLQMLCRSHELPFDAEEVTNTNGASHLLSIRSDNIVLHVVRTDDPDGFPVDAPIRQDHRATNRPDLFDNPKIVSIAEALKDVPRLYGWLAWGATKRGELAHLCLEMPEPRQDMWLAHEDILRAVLASKAKDARPAEPDKSAPNPALLLEFREEIARSLESDDNKEEGEDV
jgi:hypothetical protein